MRRTSLLAVAVILALLPGNRAWGQSNLPNNPNAATVQGPDPTGMLGYPLATVPATGALPWPVAVQSFAASLAVTQGTSPWVVQLPGRDFSGTIAGAITTVGPVDVSDMGSATVLFVSGAGLGSPILFQGSSDGTTWNSLYGSKTDGSAGTGPGLFLAMSSSNSTQQFEFDIAGLKQVRFILQGAVGGSVAVSGHASVSPHARLPFSGPGNIDVSQSIPMVSLWVRNDQTGNYRTPSSIPVTSSFGNAAIPHLMCQADLYLWDPIASNEVAARNVRSFQTVATAAAGNTALWTPAAGKKFRLMRYMLTVSDQATQAAPGTVTFSLFDGAAGVTGQVHDVFVPALGLVNNGSLYSSGWIDLGNGYLSTAANNVLNINLSAALTAGTVRVICCGTEE